MAFCFRDVTEDSIASGQEVLRCPFLRNINQPTNFSFSSSTALPLPVHGTKGPIFEDGPNFDMAFRLFHGQDGVVPLSGKSYVRSENLEPEESLLQFNPLAAKAATISLSSFGFGGPFGFDSFSEKWKNQKKKSQPSKKENSSQGGKSSHEALSNEWLQSGNCPIAKSYRAVSGVLPLVAKVLKPPSGINIKCPPAIVAARAAISKTAFAKNLRPQPLPNKVLVIGVLGMAVNVPLGIWREHTKKFSLSWFAAVHAAVPFIGLLRKSVLMPKAAMAFTIGASILGQVIGSRAERYRLKMVASRRSSVSAAGIGAEETEVDSKAKLQPVAPISGNGGSCGKNMKWDPLSLQLAGTSSSSGTVIC